MHCFYIDSCLFVNLLFSFSAVYYLWFFVTTEYFFPYFVLTGLSGNLFSFKETALKQTSFEVVHITYSNSCAFSDTASCKISCFLTVRTNEQFDEVEWWHFKEWAKFIRPCFSNSCMLLDISNVKVRMLLERERHLSLADGINRERRKWPRCLTLILLRHVACLELLTLTTSCNPLELCKEHLFHSLSHILHLSFTPPNKGTLTYPMTSLYEYA